MDKYDYTTETGDQYMVEVDYNNYTHLNDRNYDKYNYKNDRLVVYYVIRLTLEKHLKEKYRDIL